MAIRPKRNRRLPRVWQLRKREPARTRTYLERGELLKAKGRDRIEKRKVRLLADQSLTPILGQKNRDALASGLVSEAPEEAQRAFEAQIGGRDTQPCWFLTRGTEIRRTVGRIHIRERTPACRLGDRVSGRPEPAADQPPRPALGGRWHVSAGSSSTMRRRLLAKPCLPPYLTSRRILCSCPIRPGQEWIMLWSLWTPRDHSWSSQRPDASLAEFGHHALVLQEGKLVKGELIYCIHHPEGQPRSVNLRENRLTALDDPALQNLWMHYETDTERGSSGAPLQLRVGGRRHPPHGY